MNEQICPRTELLPGLSADIFIPSEIWANFANIVTLPESAVSDGVGSSTRQVLEMIGEGIADPETDSGARGNAVITESSEALATKPLNKYIQKMILAEKMPIDTTCLRHSSRATRYDCFKVNLVTDAKKPQSKVKCRGLQRLLFLQGDRSLSKVGTAACCGSV